jgi:hypothetical protein
MSAAHGEEVTLPEFQVAPVQASSSSFSNSFMDEFGVHPPTSSSDADTQLETIRSSGGEGDMEGGREKARKPAASLSRLSAETGEGTSTHHGSTPSIPLTALPDVQQV